MTSTTSVTSLAAALTVLAALGAAQAIASPAPGAAAAGAEILPEIFLAEAFLPEAFQVADAGARRRSKARAERDQDDGSLSPERQAELGRLRQELSELGERYVELDDEVQPLIAERAPLMAERDALWARYRRAPADAAALRDVASRAGSRITDAERTELLADADAIIAVRDTLLGRIRQLDSRVLPISEKIAPISRVMESIQTDIALLTAEANRIRPLDADDGAVDRLNAKLDESFAALSDAIAAEAAAPSAEATRRVSDLIADVSIQATMLDALSGPDGDAGATIGALFKVGPDTLPLFADRTLSSAEELDAARAELERVAWQARAAILATQDRAALLARRREAVAADVAALRARARTEKVAASRAQLANAAATSQANADALANEIENLSLSEATLRAQLTLSRDNFDRAQARLVADAETTRLPVAIDTLDDVLDEFEDAAEPPIERKVWSETATQTDMTDREGRVFRVLTVVNSDTPAGEHAEFSVQRVFRGEDGRTVLGVAWGARPEGLGDGFQDALDDDANDDADDGDADDGDADDGDADDGDADRLITLPGVGEFRTIDGFVTFASEGPAPEPRVDNSAALLDATRAEGRPGEALRVGVVEIVHVVEIIDDVVSVDDYGEAEADREAAAAAMAALVAMLDSESDALAEELGQAPDDDGPQSEAGLSFARIRAEAEDLVALRQRLAERQEGRMARLADAVLLANRDAARPEVVARLQAELGREHEASFANWQRISELNELFQGVDTAEDNGWPPH